MAFLITPILAPNIGAVYCSQLGAALDDTVRTTLKARPPHQKDLVMYHMPSFRLRPLRQLLAASCDLPGSR